jgi:uroporphyrinogen decarboxylase
MAMLLTETLFLKPAVRMPVWLMRQAGRYLPEYRALRQKAGSFLTMCYTPDLATEITLQPLARFDLDAAIIFSDILVVPHALGQDLRFVEGEGPLLAPLTDEKILDVKNLAAFLTPVYQAIRQTRAALPKEKALIGFCGAPWTLACYMIDGKGGGFPEARALALKSPERINALIATLTDAITMHLEQQIRAGANAVQIFDSWAALCPQDRVNDWVIAPMNAVCAYLQKNFPAVPVIGFPRGLGALYPSYVRQTAVNGVGVDQAQSLGALASAAARDVCFQGNLDPEILLRGGDEMIRATQKICADMTGRPFVFNLGHGVIKETPPENVSRLIDAIRRQEGRAAA